MSTPTSTYAAEGPLTVQSPFGGNGHNVSFDGRLYLTRRGGDADGGWFLTMLRPERVRYGAGGLPNFSDGAFSPAVRIQPVVNNENALAICEPDADRTPYACNEAGDATADGPFACYDLVIFYSDAVGTLKPMWRRELKVWVGSPGSGDAQLHKHEWRGDRQNVKSGLLNISGIEPTVTRDGRLLVWQGHPLNVGLIDVLMYATNDTPCAAGGWDGPHVVSHMFNDPRVTSRWRLGERQLRAADGTPFGDGAIVRGGYPWLFPNGDAIIFAAAPMPCRADNDPSGCGPRRNAMSVIGYPTNWGVAHIDGDVNPSTADTVRLFFSSPGPDTFEQLPITGGVDVWPFFGSNTSNYTEVVFDDALDGRYGGVWHMNESVNAAGDLDRGRTPDTSGYFNTGIVRNATFPEANNGLFGKALVFDGASAHVEVPDNASLDPVNALTVEMWIHPDAPVDCDGNNNYRVLLAKPDLGGAYSLVFEEGQFLQARVRAGGQERTLRSSVSVPLSQWSHVGFSYDGTTGQMQLSINGEITDSTTYPPGTLSGNGGSLLIGGPTASSGGCPPGGGHFRGAIDEVRISRVVRDLTVAARPGNHARFVSQQVPTQVEAGQTFDARFTFRNVGTHRWSSILGHRLGAEAPMDAERWGTGRVELPAVVQPGESVTVDAQLTAPTELGAHPMQWRLVHEGAEWFGSPTEEISVEVVPVGTLPPDEVDAGVPQVGDGLDAGMAGADAMADDGAGDSPNAGDDGFAGRGSGASHDQPTGDAGAGAMAAAGGGCTVARHASHGTPVLGGALLVLGAWWRRRRR